MNTLLWKIMPTKWRLRRLKKQGLQIGEGCEILNGYSFGSEPWLVTIGNNVRITSGVRITTHDGGVWVLRRMRPDLEEIDLFGRVSIGDNCHIGMGAFIAPGVSIGCNCIVGAGAVVTKSIPDGMVVAGVPARIVCTIDEYREKNAARFMPTKLMSGEDKRRYVIARDNMMETKKMMER